MADTRPVKFTWAANPEPDIAGYKVYAGRATGVYDAPGSPKVVGLVTTTTFDITPDGGDWFFALTAFNTSDLESGFSAEVRSRILGTRGALRGF
jgi:hypothetical protein